MYGVGIIIKKHLKKDIENIRFFNERICSITLKIQQTKITIIQIYAPTEKASDEEIDNFYNKLDYAYQETKSEIMFVIGDFNAKLGRRKDEENKTMGNFGYGQRNGRGERLLSWLHETNMVFGNSFFKKKEKNKWTWRSPDGRTKNEIDLILTNKLSTLTDVSVLNNFKFDSDHRIVRAKIQIDHQTLRRNQQKIAIPKAIETERLQRYNEMLSRHILQHIDYNNIPDNIQTIYDTLENIIRTTAKNTIMKPIDQKSDKLSDETKQLICLRQKLKNETNQTQFDKIRLKNLCNTIRTKSREDIKNFNEAKIKNILQNTKSIKKTKTFLSKEKEWIISVQSKAKTKTKRVDINETATTFFEDLFDSSCTETDEQVNILTSTELLNFTQTDIETTIESMKNEKSSGNDGIEAEMLKYGKSALTPILTKLFNEIIKTQQIPKQWRESTIILLHKKGNKSDINNYRPISLISTIYKLFSKALYKLVKKCLNDNQPREQAGFREGYSTSDHLQTINQLIEKHNEFKEPLYLLFIDFTKAFDTVEHNCIWTALKNQNIHPDFIRTMRSIYCNNKAKVKTDKTGRYFDIKRGVRQGDPLSPPLFSAVLEDIFRQLKWKKYGLDIWGEKLNNLRFADDVVLLSHSPEEIQSMTNDLSIICEKYGLSLNLTKTKLMTNHIKKDVLLLGKKIAYVDDLIYLGQLKSFINQEEKEIKRRIENSWKQFWNVKRILDSNLSNDMKKYILDSTILPTMTYGLETLGLTTNSHEMLRICQTKIERKLLNIRQVQRIRNEDIRKTTNITDVIQRTKRLKWNWAGHISRMEDRRWTKLVTKWMPSNTKRPRGRPKRRWTDDLRQFNQHWYNDAKNRDIWAALGEAYAGS